MTHSQSVDTVLVLKSLADDTRLSIVRKLLADSCEVASSEIVSGCSEFLRLSQPAISHHFGRLVASGVLTERKVGVEKYYRLDTVLLQRAGIDIKNL